MVLAIGCIMCDICKALQATVLQIGYISMWESMIN